MLRYHKHSYLVRGWQLSKSPIYKLSDLVELSRIDLQAGHFRPGSTYVEHGLMIMNLSAQAPKVEVFKHGKRERHTLLIKITSSSNWRWAIYDRFIHSILPLIGDLSTSKHRRSEQIGSMYSWRLRNFFEWAEADSLLSDRALKKDIYLPLFFNLYLSSRLSSLQNEHVMRMYRTPVVLYRKDRPVVGDDLLR